LSRAYARLEREQQPPPPHVAAAGASGTTDGGSSSAAESLPNAPAAAAPPMSPSSTSRTKTAASTSATGGGEQLLGGKSTHGSVDSGSSRSSNGLLELFGGLDLTCPGHRSNRPRSLLELASQVMWWMNRSCAGSVLSDIWTCDCLPCATDYFRLIIIIIIRSTLIPNYCFPANRPRSPRMDRGLKWCRGCKQGRRIRSRTR